MKTLCAGDELYRTTRLDLKALYCSGRITAILTCCISQWSDKEAQYRALTQLIHLRIKIIVKFNV